MLQIHHANGTARVLQVAVADRITDVTQHILKLREVVSLRHVVWIVIPEANPKFIFWVLPVCVRYTHRLFALPPHIIPHICRSVVSETLGADLPTPTLTAQIDPVQSRAEARKPPFYNGFEGSAPKFPHVFAEPSST